MSRKYIFAVAFFSVVFTTLNAQNFCGHIKYRYIYLRAKTGKDITKKTRDVKTEDFYICGKNFKTYYDGKLESIYFGDSLTYFQSATDKVMGYVKADSAYGQDVPLYTNFKDNSYKGKEYRSMENGPVGDKITYYFSDRVKIDPAVFSDMQLYHWNTFFNASQGAIRLISIYEGEEITIISEVSKIEDLNLTPKDFEVPADYKFQPYVSINIEN